MVYESKPVGELHADDEGRLSFRYLSEWADDPSSFPISASLPLEGGWIAGREDHRWFANLLPEGIAREGLCRLYGISVSNDAALGDCVQVIRRDHQAPAKDLLRLVRWQVFNVLVGNSDGHAKNLSRIYDSSRGRLAPFYDLVCTAAYDGFSPKLAMSVGSRTEAGQIRRPDWEDMASTMGIRSNLVFREIERITTSLQEHLDSASDGLPGDGGCDAAIGRVRAVVRNRVRRVLGNL